MGDPRRPGVVDDAGPDVSSGRLQLLPGCFAIWRGERGRTAIAGPCEQSVAIGRHFGAHAWGFLRRRHALISFCRNSRAWPGEGIGSTASSRPDALSLFYLDCSEAGGGSCSRGVFKHPRIFGAGYLATVWWALVRSGNVEPSFWTPALWLACRSHRIVCCVGFRKCGDGGYRYACVHDRLVGAGFYRSRSSRPSRIGRKSVADPGVAHLRAGTVVTWSRRGNWYGRVRFRGARDRLAAAGRSCPQ